MENSDFDGEKIRKYLNEKKVFLKAKGINLQEVFIDKSFRQLKKMGITTEKAQKLIEKTVNDILEIREYLYKKCAELKQNGIDLDSESIENVFYSIIYNAKVIEKSKSTIDSFYNTLMMNKDHRENSNILYKQFLGDKNKSLESIVIDLKTFWKGTNILNKLKQEDEQVADLYQKYLFSIGRLYDVMRRIGQDEKRDFNVEYLNKIKELYGNYIEVLSRYVDNNPKSVLNKDMILTNDSNFFISMIKSFEFYYKMKTDYESSKAFVNLFGTSDLASQLLNDNSENGLKIKEIAPKYQTTEMFPLETKLNQNVSKALVIDFFNSINETYGTSVAQVLNDNNSSFLEFDKNPRVCNTSLGLPIKVVLSNFGDLRDLYSAAHEFTHFLDSSIGSGLTKRCFSETNAQCMERCLDNYLLSLSPEQLEKYNIDSKVLHRDINNRIVATFFTRQNSAKSVASNQAKLCDNGYVISQIYSTEFSKMSYEDQKIKIQDMIASTKNNNFVNYLQTMLCNLTRQNEAREMIVNDTLKEILKSYQNILASLSKKPSNSEEQTDKKPNIFTDSKNSRAMSQANITQMSPENQEQYEQMRENTRKLGNQKKLVLAKKNKEDSTTFNNDSSSGYVNVFLLTLGVGFVSGIVSVLAYLFISRG